MGDVKSLEKLLKQLNNKKISTSIQKIFFDLGDSAFDFLLDNIKDNKTLSSKQIANSLHILFFLSREKCYGRQSEIFRIANILMRDENKEIRTESAIISVYLSNLFVKFPDLNPEYDRLHFVLEIRNVLSIGVLDKAISLLEKHQKTNYHEIMKLLIKRYEDRTLCPEKARMDYIYPINNELSASRGVNNSSEYQRYEWKMEGKLREHSIIDKGKVENMLVYEELTRPPFFVDNTCMI